MTPMLVTCDDCHGTGTHHPSRAHMSHEVRDCETCHGDGLVPDPHADVVRVAFTGTATLLLAYEAAYVRDCLRAELLPRPRYSTIPQPVHVPTYEFRVGGALGVDSEVATALCPVLPDHEPLLPAIPNLLTPNQLHIFAPHGLAHNEDLAHAQVALGAHLHAVHGGYLRRNELMIRGSLLLPGAPDRLADRLIAFPRTPGEERRSGTWHTIRLARRHGVPVTICPLSQATHPPTRKRQARAQAKP